MRSPLRSPLQELGRVAVREGLDRGLVGVAVLPFVGLGGRRAGQAGVEAGADAVDIAPGAQIVPPLELLRRGEAGGVHGFEDGLLGPQGLARSEERRVGKE